LGPIDGHDIGLVRKYLAMASKTRGPVLLHVVTEKGHGYKPAAEDPVYFHTPPAFQDQDGKAVPKKSEGLPAYTQHARDAIRNQMASDKRVTVITAAMCQGNKLEPIRERFPDQFFDVGICESHAVAFAAGQCKAGSRPIVDIYSTFLQRSFDQIFQEVALQNLPVVFCMDRAGLCGPDGPTHHGVFDNSYMRIFPNMVVTAPADEADLPLLLDFALESDSPVSVRYPKTAVNHVKRVVAPVVKGKAEVLSEGTDGTILSCGTMLADAVAAADLLKEQGISVGIVNARFVKPIDEQMVLDAASRGFVITIEENTIVGGFGSAVLETAAAHQLSTERFRVLGIPDQFVEHGDRNELLADLGLDAAGLVRVAHELVGRPLTVG